MRSVIAIGETVLDIIIKNGKTIATNPGGSMLNTMVSISRLGLVAKFISDIGSDESGSLIESFLTENQIDTQHLTKYSGFQTTIALAFLDQNNNATYNFYKNFPSIRFNGNLPECTSNDIFLFGSSFGVNPDVRPTLLKLLESAQVNGSIIYYDPNYRPKPNVELSSIKPTILENIQYCNILRGSDDDFNAIFGHTNLEEIQKECNAPNLQIIICTKSDSEVCILIDGETYSYTVPPVKTVSTVGAGDTFNAGFIYGLINNGITLHTLSTISESTLEHICNQAVACAGNVCASTDNYISKEFGTSIQSQNN